MILHWKARDPSMKISPFSVEDVHCFFLQLATLRSFFFFSAGAKASSI